MNLNREVVRCILKHEKKFKPTKVQQITQADKNKRIIYCQWARKNLDENPEFFRNVIFTVESVFTNRGTVNPQCGRTRARTNPHRVIPIDNQKRWRVLVTSVDGDCWWPIGWSDIPRWKSEFGNLFGHVNESTSRQRIYGGSRMVRHHIMLLPSPISWIRTQTVG